MTKQPSAEFLSKRMDIATQNELIHYDDHQNIQKNVAAFFADQQPRSKPSQMDPKVMLGSSSLPSIHSAGNSPNNYRGGAMNIRNGSPDSVVDYGGRSLVDVSPKKFELISKSATPQIKSSP